MTSIWFFSHGSLSLLLVERHYQLKNFLLLGKFWMMGMATIPRELSYIWYWDYHFKKIVLGLFVFLVYCFTYLVVYFDCSILLGVWLTNIFPLDWVFALLYRSDLIYEVPLITFETNWWAKAFHLRKPFFTTMSNVVFSL